MSKQKLIETIICLQSNYSAIEGIVSCSNSLQFFSLPKEQSSSLLIPTINEFLHKANSSIDNVDCIIANQGPAPFTSLRTVIATVNGIAYATGIPLVSVNGLKALLAEYTDKQKVTVALLNAFHKTVYYGIQTENTQEIGCLPIEQLLQTLKEKIAPLPIHFIGNGVKLYQEKIIETFENAVIDTEIPMYCSIEQVMKIGYSSWQSKQNVHQQIEPLYLKKPI